MLVALLTLTDWNWATDNEITILSLMFLEALLFTSIMVDVAEQWLYRVGVVNGVFRPTLRNRVDCVGIDGSFYREFSPWNYLHAGFVSIALAASLAFQVFLALRKSTAPFNASEFWYLPDPSEQYGGFSVIGILSGIMPLVVFGYFYDQLWAVIPSDYCSYRSCTCETNCKPMGWG